MSTTPHQRGFVLVTAVIFLVVLSLLGVMAMRNSLFEERFAANDRDRAMARESAELALRDAERDIQGLRFDGQFCSTAACTTLRPAGTRPINATDAGNFWTFTNNDLVGLINDPAVPVASDDGGNSLGANTRGVYTAFSATGCGGPVWTGANWNDGTVRTCAGTFNVSVPVVTYGTFTDAPVAAFAPANLQAAPPPQYIIEMFTARDLGLINSSNKFVFRVTGVGYGRTTGSNGARTSVTLQSVFSPL